MREILYLPLMMAFDIIAQLAERLARVLPKEGFSFGLPEVIMCLSLIAIPIFTRWLERHDERCRIRDGHYEAGDTTRDFPQRGPNTH